eukprot:4249531-Karenia_brevis.AAC.1
MVKIGRRTVVYKREDQELTQIDVGDCSEDSTEESESTCESSSSESDLDVELESYVAWIQRATRIAEDALSRANLEDWVNMQRRWKWRWAGHAARRTDHRWSCEVLDWNVCNGRRSPGHPLKRWQDSINDYTWSILGALRG